MPATLAPPTIANPVPSAPSAPSPPTAQPRPATAPIAIVWAVITSATQVGFCPTEGSDDYRKKSNDGGGGNTKNTKRQKPCEEGEPTITYKERRRTLGFIVITPPPIVKAQAGSILERREAKAFLEKVERNKNNKGQQVRIEFNRTTVDEWQKHPGNSLLDNISATAAALTVARCIYKVEEITQRRICKCPDGSPCRKTRY